MFLFFSQTNITQMSMETGLIYFILTLSFLWAYQCLDRKIRNLPPGPFQVPFIGNLWQIYRADSKYPHKAIAKLSKQYGNVMLIKTGLVNTVIINDYDTIKELGNSEKCDNRFDADWCLHRSFCKKIGKCNVGLISSSDGNWWATRQFTIRNLRNFGFSKSTFQQNFIDTEMLELTRILDQAIENCDGIVELQNLFKICAVNIVWASVANTRFSHDDPKIIKFTGVLDEYAKNSTFVGGIAFSYPFLVKWFPNSFSIKKVYQADDEMHIFMKNQIEEIREQGTYKANPNSFLEIFLQHMESDRVITEQDKQVFCEESLISILYDLFHAGSDTTSSMISFAFVWLTMYPEIQEKIRTELVEVIETGRQATLADKRSLPYTRSFILELYRLSHVGPLAPRQINRNVTFGKYFIPKGTHVLMNLHSVMMDQVFWGDPHNFRPTRFLDDQNNIITAERVIPFGLGKRNCVGEPLAESTIFAFITKLLQLYEFLPASAGQIFKTDPIPGTGLSLQKCQVKVRKRL